MATIGTKTRHSSSVKTLEISNDANVSIAASSGSFAPLIDPTIISSYERATIQIRNVDNTSTPKVRVYGSLFPAPGAAPTTTTPADSKWVQIGDDIDVAASSGAIKSISTTGLKMICVVARDSASNTQTFPLGDCLVFLQGTI